jgi:chemotaxis protein MotB
MSSASFEAAARRRQSDRTDAGVRTIADRDESWHGKPAIFLIMLMVFALDFRTKSDSQDDALDVARQAAEKVEALQHEVQANISALDESAALRRTLLRQIRDELLQRGIQVEISSASDVLRIRENAVEFETGESVLDQRAQQNVEIIAEVLSSVLRDYVACRAVGDQRVCSQSDGATIETVFVEGHTDSRGDDRDNWELSTARTG